MKTFLGAAAVLIGLYGYYPYFRDIFKGKTKPHAISWLVWGTLTGIGFFAQVHDGAKAGSWITGITALVCFIIFILAIYRGEKDITRGDWLCLLGAFVAILFWVATDSPLISVVLITLIDALGFVPTIRKTYKKPNEETLMTFSLSGVKFALAILALSNYSIVTVLYPASLVLMNWLFVVLIFYKRKSKV